MTDRVDQNPPLIGRGLMLGLAGAQRDSGLHRRIQIINSEVEVHLLVLWSQRP